MSPTPAVSTVSPPAPLSPLPAPPPQVELRAELAQTLALVADTIVESLGFDVAVINICHDEETMLVAAVCGPQEVKDALLRRRQGRAGWATLMTISEPWGPLRFIDGRNSHEDPDDLMAWVPNIEVSDDPDAWHPEDSLFAPLSAADGTLLGMLSVDVPRDGRRPDAATRRGLEAFAVAAALALEHATLAARSRASVRQFQAVFTSSPIAIGLVEPGGAFLTANDALCGFLHRRTTSIVGTGLLELLEAGDRAAAAAALAATWEKGVPAPVEGRWRLPGADTAWGRLHLALVEGEDDAGPLVIAQVEDITERKRTELRLQQQALFDSLTGLPNRHHSLRALRDALDGSGTAGTVTAVFFCDLDRLKLVNDAHGHATGDAYLRAVSQRIRRSVRDSDTVGRLSGDEFIVVLSGLHSPIEGLELAARIVDAVREPLTLGGTTFSPSLSLGIAYDDGTLTPDELIANADAAMYQAKLEERGSWYVYDASLRHSSASVLQLRNDVSGALERGELVLHYQPIVRLLDRRVLAHEALLRWQHPTRGLLGPAQFLEVVLDSEFESPVTDWILMQACRDAAAQPSGTRRVNVNVSSLQVGRRDLPDVIRRCLDETGLDARHLVLELTEDRLLSRPDGPALLEGLREIGVGLAIDDFGTGFAGLGYLQRFPAITAVKLDRSFIAGLGTDPVSEHIVSAVVQLARACGIGLVTEGVETQVQADELLHLGVEHAQGWLLGVPAPLTPADPAPAAPSPAEPSPVEPSPAD